MVKEEIYVPRQGDIVWITLTPQRGHEQSGRRPAVVLSPESYNRKTGLTILCPITNQIKGYPFEVQLPSSDLVTGAILSDQVKSLDWRMRDVEFICRLPDIIVNEIFEKLKTLLNLPGRIC